MKTTIREVAEAAGVSAMAVSVVLNGAGRKKVTVSPEKAELIRQIGRELRYQPNHIARSLRNHKTNQVAVVFQHFCGITIENPYHIQVLNGVAMALFSHGYAMTLCPKMMEDGGAVTISDGRFDGVLWCRPDFSEGSLDAIQHATVPVVLMHVPPTMAAGVPTHCADNDGAMCLVVEHLASLGHRQLAFVIDPITVNTVEGKTRFQALITACEAAGLPAPDLVLLHSDHSILAHYVHKSAPHTALVCFSDELAGFVLKSCLQFGVLVPQHVSVVGFDSSSFCDSTKPRLTSVNQPVARMAQLATNHLLSLIHSDDQGIPRSPIDSSIYDCGLDIRESTAPPRPQ